MDFTAFLSATDAERAKRSYTRLIQLCDQPPVLTGGLAIGLYLSRFGLVPEARPLNDMDFLATSFQELPQQLSRFLLFLHVHPHDPPGKTLMQGVDPETAVRIDFFGVAESVLSRSISLELCGSPARVISIEDLTARTARLCLDLATNTPTPAKHARDFLHLLPLVEPDSTEEVWREHRKPNHPESFKTVANLLPELIATRKELQIEPPYSQDVLAICPRCQPTEMFPLADPRQVIALLGYR
jgi:hypothetical protein